jgi:signal transduction histidine kinase
MPARWWGREARSVLAWSGLVLVGLLAAFAYALVSSHRSAQREIEARFHDRAEVTATVIDSVFVAAGAQTQAEARVELGGAHIPPSALRERVRASRLLHASVLDAGGRVLASTDPRLAGGAVRAPHVDRAARGRPALSDVRPRPDGNGRMIEWALPFQSRQGMRVLLLDYPIGSLAGFLAASLQQVGDGDRNAFIVDRAAHVVASPDTARAGRRLPDRDVLAALRERRAGRYEADGEGRYFTSSPVPGSSWRIVLTAARSDLFAPISGTRRWLPWAVFAAFALAGLLSLLLMRHLRDSERRNRTLLESLDAGVIVFGADGSVASANAAAERIIAGPHRGVSLVGTSFADPRWAAVREDGTELRPQELPAAVTLATGRPCTGVVIGIGRPEERRWLLVNTHALRDTADERMEAVVASFIDITARKRGEEELRRSNAELDQFAAVASHDLQEPLRVISGMSEVMSKRYGAKLDPLADQMLDAIARGARRGQALVDGLLTYSRVSTAAISIAPVDLGQLVRDTVAVLDVMIRERGAEVTADRLPVVEADAAQLARVLQNLIGNAVKFNDKPTPRVHVAAEAAHAAWRISVRDNGPGIPAEHVDRVFGMFQRAHGADTAGTGMGLAICQRIVERHGGRIWVESGPDGSTFTFTLPAQRDIPTEADGDDRAAGARVLTGAPRA